VENRALFGEGLCCLLKSHGYHVVGQAADAPTALQAIKTLSPHLVLISQRVPSIGGIELARRIKLELPSVKVIILSETDDDEYLFEALENGADACLSIALAAGEFFPLLKNALCDGVGMLPDLTERLSGKIVRHRGHLMLQHLTEREREVLLGAARGHTNEEIAQLLNISRNTVKYHLRCILAKLHMRNRAQIAAWAAQNSFIEPEPAEPNHPPDSSTTIQE
jgi:DNA-binding NarL/FixJ family response regulator